MTCTLCWDKPKQVMTKEERGAYTADGSPPGCYVPNMSHSDIKKWKAKLLGKKSGFPRVEIRKNSFVVVVSLGNGYAYKFYKPEHTKGIQVHIASAGPIQLTFKELDELNDAVNEARDVLVALDLQK